MKNGKTKRFYSTKIRPPVFTFGSVSLLTIPAAAFGLAIWQYQRRDWKLNLIAELEQKMRTKPIDLPKSIDEANRVEYRRVRCIGKYDHKNEVIIRPRIFIDSSDSSMSSLASLSSSSVMENQTIAMKNNNAGAHVITPFILNDGRKILVNRGFVPSNKIDVTTRGKGQIKDEVTVTGVVRLSESGNAFAIDNKPEKNEWHQRDVIELATHLHTAPVFVDADETTTVSGGPVGGQTKLNLRNEHLSYILTWLGVGVSTSVLWFLKFVK
ncbi:hypothetical protein SNEBB_009121 [Seison nebaliae]|nr:hypothetical protein SNEBB_009121 [Seison nebaliae]